jgi:hypothetical protein
MMNSVYQIEPENSTEWRVLGASSINVTYSLERATAGEFEGAEWPPQGFSEAPKGELDSPLEVPRHCEIIEPETLETGH